MIKVTVSGVGGIKHTFASMAKDLPVIVDSELQTMSQKWVRDAKRDAPADQSALRGAITYYKSGEAAYEIVSQKFYSPFMEFGTKGKYDPIPGTEKIAAQFKGYKGGDFMDLLRAIVRWVRRKNIVGTYSVKTHRRTKSKVTQFAEDYSAAWPIAMSILKNGVTPHPFFFKQMHTLWPEMIRNIERRIAQKSGVKVVMPENNKNPKIITI